MKKMSSLRETSANVYAWSIQRRKSNILFFILMILFTSNLRASDNIIKVAFRDILVEDALKTMEKTSSLNFYYNAEDVSNFHRVSYEGESTINNILSEILDGTSLVYKVTENDVMIIKRASDTSKEHTISGVVYDENGETMVGVTVMVKGTNNGVITDVEGQFRLQIRDATEVIVIRYIGMKQQEIVVGSKSTFKVVMESDQKQIEEIVVVGYGSAKKSDLTGSVSSLSPKEGEGLSFSSVDGMLKGKLSGVQVQSNGGTPGAAESVIIRGAGSLRGDNQPLYVVDNIPLASAAQNEGNAIGSYDYQTVQNALSNIDPNDIEDIQVLKDASATAIYGSRGANGVILITTKKGKKGKAKINFQASTGISNVSKKIDVLDLKSYAAYQNEFLGTEDFIVQPDGNVHRINMAGSSMGVYDPKDPTTYALYQPRNWQDELYQTGVSQNYSISASGGIKGLDYFVSFGHKDIEGIVKGSSLQQSNMRVNLNSNLSEKLSMALTMSGNIRRNTMMQSGDLNGGITGSSTRAAVNQRPYFTESDEFENITGRSSVKDWIDDYDDLSNEYAMQLGLNIKYKLAKGLSYSFRTGGNYRSKERSRWFGLGLFQGFANNGLAANSNLLSTNYTIENLINFNKSFTNNFRISGVIGTSLDKYTSLNKLEKGLGFDSQVLRAKGIHLANTVVALTPLQRDFQLQSYLGRMNFYFFDGKYILTTNFRADGSSKFPNHRWGYFPSTSFAWKLSEERFLKQVDALYLLKLRAGWGRTGNQSIAPYSTIPNYTGTNFTYSDINDGKLVGVGVNNLANPDITWETSESINFGLDFGLFENRISGSIDVYSKLTKELLNQKQVPTSTGFGIMLINQGSLENRGLELNINTVLIDKAVKLRFGGNLTVNRSEVMDLGFNTAQFGAHQLEAFLGSSIGNGNYFAMPANIFAVGREQALFWGYKTDGIIQEQSDITIVKDGKEQTIEYKNSGRAEVGDIKFVDVNGDGVVDVNDKTFIGNPNPDFSFGLNASVSFKGFDLSVALNGTIGQDILNSGLYLEESPSSSRNIRTDVYQNAWRVDTPSSLYPKIGSSEITDITDRYIEDGSFVRLSNVTLSYTLPKGICNKLHTSSLKFYVTGNNLAIWTDYKGYDPEVNSFSFDGTRQGVDWNSFPKATTVTFGCNIQF
ncbi:TonB-dependent receptor [Halosquirtibacter xylanolyticus]|uniref:TonB-dependent receptor n=1 Tax=Halosquirtibacter xylanolyticus TaxID=3374599 RepID=UPI003747C7EF|nr:TonB-dependent receptor [Prolixibacteraceae bacterium]